MKRICSILFALCLVVALSLSISAESTNTLTYAVGASAPTVSANTEFTVFVDITENTGICWLKAVVTYDSSVLSYVGASTDTSVFDPAKIQVNHKDGKAIVVLGDMSVIFQSDPTIYKNTGRLVALTFKVNPLAVGETTINVSTDVKDVLIRENSVTNYDYAVTNASLTLRVLNNAEHTCVPDAEIKENIVPANCTQMGSYDSIIKCTICGGEISRTKVVLPVNEDHAPGEAAKENVVAGTCKVEETYDLVTRCTRCNKIIKTENKKGSKGDHIGDLPEVIYTPSTCTTEGSLVEVQKCKICGVELSRRENAIPLANHTPGAPKTENVVPSTCTTAGSHSLVTHCMTCDKVLSTEEVTDEKLPHTPGDPVEENRVEPKDCLTKGSYDIVIRCKDCNAEISRTPQTIPVAAHQPGDPPTETTPQTCVVCGYILQSALGHTHKWETELIGNTSGHWYACSGCAEKKDYSVHNYDNACDATCNDCGMAREVVNHQYDNDCDTTCNVCGAKRTTTHKYDNSCDTTCNVCGAKRSITHTYDNSCDKDCNVCGETRSITHKYDNSCDEVCNVCAERRAIVHTYSNDCDDTCNVCSFKRTVPHKYDNNCDATCNECGAKRTPADHIYGSWYTVTEPTTTTEGKRERKCIVCEHTISESIPVLEEVTTEEPPVTTNPPETTKEPEVTTNPPETTKEPEVTTNPPETTKEPEVTTNPPETTEEPEVTTAPETTKTPEVTTKPADTTEPKDDKGCGSVVSVGIAVIAILGSAIILKKRD